MTYDWKPEVPSIKPQTVKITGWHIIFCCLMVAGTALTVGLATRQISYTAVLIITVVVGLLSAAVLGAEMHRIRWISSEIVPRLDEIAEEKTITGYLLAVEDHKHPH